jgi:xylulokinase
MPLVVGIDSSTQSTKVEARNIETGEVVARASSPHPKTEPPVSEQDPEAWWAALTAAVVSLGEHRRDVVAMAVAGQQHGLVLIDEAGAVVRPAKLWNDTTSSVEAAALVASVGADKWATGCGSLPVAAFTVSKLAWMAANEPRSLERTAKIMLPHDYLTWRLTGEHITDRGDASGTGWFDPKLNIYRQEFLAAAAPGPNDWIERLPTVLGPDQVAGELSPEAAASLGLPQSVVVGPGTGDNMAAALGLGLRTGDAAMSLGTSGTVYAVSETPTADTTGAVAGFADASGRYLPLVCTLNATRVTDTMAMWMGTDPSGLSDLALRAPAGAHGVVLVPYFDGERTPNLPNATGSLLGVRNSTSREVLARAGHDGVLCGLLNGLDQLGSAGMASGGRLLLIGGGARSGAYRQRCADLHGHPILVPSADESVAAGAALQAASLNNNLERSSIAVAWGLGAGLTVEPTASDNGALVRAEYAAALSTDAA